MKCRRQLDQKRDAIAAINMLLIIECIHASALLLLLLLCVTMRLYSGIKHTTLTYTCTVKSIRHYRVVYPPPTSTRARCVYDDTKFVIASTLELLVDLDGVDSPPTIHSQWYRLYTAYRAMVLYIITVQIAYSLIQPNAAVLIKGMKFFHSSRISSFPYYLI